MPDIELQGGYRAKATTRRARAGNGGRPNMLCNRWLPCADGDNLQKRPTKKGIPGYTCKAEWYYNPSRKTTCIGPTSPTMAEGSLAYKCAGTACVGVQGCATCGKESHEPRYPCGAANMTKQPATMRAAAGNIARHDLKYHRTQGFSDI